jgi:hypothetical protein
MSSRLSEYSNAAQAQSRRLSSVLTPVYKLGFSATLMAIGVVSTSMHLINGGGPGIGMAFMWIGLILVSNACFRLKKVFALSDHLLIGNYLMECRVPYDEIDEIKGYRGQSIVFVRLHLRNACRFGRTIHFLLPTKLAMVESQPEIKMLREKCPWLCQTSRSWWLGTFYLKPPAIKQGETDEAGKGQQ